MTALKGPGRPKRGYHSADGTKVPSVTDIIRRFKESEGLLRWAWSQGKAGVPLNQKRDWAADLGTMIHKTIELSVLGDREALDAAVNNADADLAPRLVNAIAAFDAWAAERKPTYVALEWPFISEQYLFGGTFDLVCEIEGRLGVVDWKTSKGHYPENVIQAGGYRQLYRENTKSGRELEWAEVVLLPRGDNGIATFVPWRVDGARFETAEAHFLALREAFRTDREIASWFQVR